VSPGYAIDRPPERLFRFYSSEVHAKAFAEEGRLRLGSLKSHRTHEDARRDQMEGSGSLLIPGDIPVVHLDRITGAVVSQSTQPGHFNYSSTFLNPTYVFCTCSPDVDHKVLSGQFGAYIVAIDDPDDFAEQLFRALQLLDLPGGRQLDFLDGSLVRYDKGRQGEYPRDPNARLRIDFAQKPLQYSHEKEYRFAAVLSGTSIGAPPYLDVRISRPGDVLRLAKAAGS
jgi:hypothetical protein